MCEFFINIFMNINVNIRNKTKLVEKLKWYTYKINRTLADNYPILQNLVEKIRGIPTKCPIRLLLTSLDYKTWYQIKVET